MEVNNSNFYYAVYDEENETYGDVKELGCVKEIELQVPDSLEISDITEFTGRLQVVSDNLKTMTPTMRKYFKTVKLNGMLYI